MKVAIYVRLSEDAKGTGLGVQRQEEQCRDWISAKGWEVGEVYRDNDLSATTGVKRPAFERMLSERPDALLCWHTDRLVRRVADLERLIDLGINIYSVEAGDKSLNLSTADGRMLARMLTTVANYEGEHKAARQRAAHRQRVDAGGLTATGRPWWPTRPLGFNLDGTHHEVEAPALRQVYTDLLTGGTLAAGVRYLEGCGIVTARSGEPWKASSLRPVLLHARNAGIYVYNGEEVGPAAWKPIVEVEVYRAVARILTSPTRRLNGENSGGFGHRTNLLTGLAKCSKCDHTVRAAWRRNSKGERTYKVYQCGGCHGVTLPAEWCDSVVTRNAIERVEQWQDMLPQRSDGARVDVGALRVRLKALESSKEELVEDRSLGILSREQLRAGLATADAEIARITDQLNDHVTEEDSGWFWDAETLWEWTDDGDGNLDVEKFTPVIKRVCQSITMTGPGKGRRELRYGTHLVIEFHEPASQSDSVA